MADELMRLAGSPRPRAPSRCSAAWGPVAVRPPRRRRAGPLRGHRRRPGPAGRPRAPGMACAWAGARPRHPRRGRGARMGPEPRRRGSARAPASPSISGRGSRRRRPTGCCAPPRATAVGALVLRGPVARWWAGDRDRGRPSAAPTWCARGSPRGPRSGGPWPRSAPRCSTAAWGGRGAARPGPAGRPRGPVTGPELIEVATDAPARAVFSTRRGGVSEGRSRR